MMRPKQIGQLLVMIKQQKTKLLFKQRVQEIGQVLLRILKMMNLNMDLFGLLQVIVNRKERNLYLYLGLEKKWV